MANLFEISLFHQSQDSKRVNLSVFVKIQQLRTPSKFILKITVCLQYELARIHLRLIYRIEYLGFRNLIEING